MNKINFTNEQIEFIKNASDHVEILCGGRGHGKTHQLINEMQDKINNLQSKIDNAIKYIKTHTNHDNCESKNYLDLTDRDNLLDILKDDK